MEDWRKAKENRGICQTGPPEHQVALCKSTAASTPFEGGLKRRADHGLQQRSAVARTLYQEMPCCVRWHRRRRQQPESPHPQNDIAPPESQGAMREEKCTEKGSTRLLISESIALSQTVTSRSSLILSSVFSVLLNFRLPSPQAIDGARTHSLHPSPHPQDRPHQSASPSPAPQSATPSPVAPSGTHPPLNHRRLSLNPDLGVLSIQFIKQLVQR